MHALGQGDVGHFKAARTRTNDGSVRRILAGHDQHGGHHGAGVQGLQHRLRHQAFGHAGSRGGCQAIHADVVFFTLYRKGLHQTRQSHFGRAVVGLAKVAIQAARRCGHNDAPVVLCLHDGPHGLGAMHRTHHMYIHHQLEVGQLHLGKTLVTQNARVVDHNIYPAPGIYRLLHHGFYSLKVGDRCPVGYGFASGCSDFVNHGLRGRHRAANPVHIAAQVIDQHFGPACGQRQRMLFAQTAASARDDGNTAFEIDAHVFSL